MVKVFDVKEALSVFIDTGETEVLIDGGNSGSGKEISKAISTYVDGPIEYVIATHSHADHVGGLDRIYEDYAVSHTIYGDTGDSKQFKEFFDAARGEPNSEMKEDVDEVIPLGEGISLSILDILDGNKNTNNNSVISVLNYNGKKMLVTGDAEDHESQDVRDRLISKLASAGLRPIDVYIVGHHGSETSSSDALLDVITPTYGIISSYGPTHKSYKNPDRDVMERLIRHNVKVYGTYRSGDITIMFKGNEIALSAPDSEWLTVENYGAAA
jgi:competence protein ComEC